MFAAGDPVCVAVADEEDAGRGSCHANDVGGRFLSSRDIKRGGLVSAIDLVRLKGELVVLLYLIMRSVHGILFHHHPLLDNRTLRKFTSEAFVGDQFIIHDVYGHWNKG